MPARLAPGWGFPSQRRSCSSTDSPSGWTARWARVQPSGSPCAIPVPNRIPELLEETAMDKLNREMDEQLEQRVADLTAHNDETGDGKLDAADLKAQLNRIEAQLELQDQQNRRIMRNQRLRMMLSLAMTAVLLIALGVFFYYARIAYGQVMQSTAQVNELAVTLQNSLSTVDPEALD